MKGLINRTIKSVSLSADKEILSLNFSDGLGDKKYQALGDCCSNSWIEHLEIPDDIDGARILSVEKLDLESCDKDECKDHPMPDTDYTHESLSIYQTKINTTKGTISIEYRNDSNGYYGGWLEEIK